VLLVRQLAEQWLDPRPLAHVHIMRLLKPGKVCEALERAGTQVPNRSVLEVLADVPPYVAGAGAPNGHSLGQDIALGRD
jgi:hypothetical protein